MTDFSNFKKTNALSNKAMYSVRVKADLLERFKTAKAEHKAAKCSPLDMERIIEDMLAKAIDYMNKEVVEKNKVKK